MIDTNSEESAGSKAGIGVPSSEELALARSMIDEVLNETTASGDSPLSVLDRLTHVLEHGSGVVERYSRQIVDTAGAPAADK